MVGQDTSVRQKMVLARSISASHLVLLVAKQALRALLTDTAAYMCTKIKERPKGCNLLVRSCLSLPQGDGSFCSSVFCHPCKEGSRSSEKEGLAFPFHRIRRAKISPRCKNWRLESQVVILVTPLAVGLNRMCLFCHTAEAFHWNCVHAQVCTFLSSDQALRWPAAVWGPARSDPEKLCLTRINGVGIILSLQNGKGSKMFSTKQFRISMAKLVNECNLLFCFGMLQKSAQ